MILLKNHFCFLKTVHVCSILWKSVRSRTILLKLFFHYQNLFQIIGPDLSRTFTNDGQPIKNKLLLGIWAFSTRESFCEVENRCSFGFAVKHTYFLFHTFFMAKLLIRYKIYVFIFQVLRLICIVNNCSI